MPVLGPVVHEQQHPGQGQALDKVVENCLGLGIDSVQVLEHDQQGLNLAYPEEQPLHRLMGFRPTQ